MEIFPEVEVVRSAAHRSAVESLYNGRCDVYEYQTVRKEERVIAKQELVCVLKKIPCRLSHGKSPGGKSEGGIVEVSQSVKLFLDPEWSILPGSKIVVTQAGVTTAYKSSGQPAIYETHQEIELELMEGRA